MLALHFGRTPDFFFIFSLQLQFATSSNSVELRPTLRLRHILKTTTPFALSCSFTSVRHSAAGTAGRFSIFTSCSADSFPNRVSFLTLSRHGLTSSSKSSSSKRKRMPPKKAVKEEKILLGRPGNSLKSGIVRRDTSSRLGWLCADSR